MTFFPLYWIVLLLDKIRLVTKQRNYLIGLETSRSTVRILNYPIINKTNYD